MLSGLFDELRRMNKRQFLYQMLSFGMIVSSALMIWKGLMIVTGSESPIVVVLSGSMEPAFHRGDLLFLTNYQEEPVRVGDIIVFKVKGRDIPIVHRVIKLHEKGNGTVKFLTKGDNNSIDDRGLYAPGQLWLTKKDMVGRARGFLPYVGMVTICMNEYPNFKSSHSPFKVCFVGDTVSLTIFPAPGKVEEAFVHVTLPCFKRDNGAEDAPHEICTTFGSAPATTTAVRNRFNKFKAGDFELEVEDPCDLPATTDTDVITTVVFGESPQHRVREMVGASGIPKTTVHNHLIEMGYASGCEILVPHLSTEIVLMKQASTSDCFFGDEKEIFS